MSSFAPLITRRRRKFSNTILNTTIKLTRYVSLSYLIDHILTPTSSNHISHLNRMAVPFTLNKWATSTSTPCTKSPPQNACSKTSLLSMKKWPTLASQPVPAKLDRSSKPAAQSWISRAWASQRSLRSTHTSNKHRACLKTITPSVSGNCT